MRKAAVIFCTSVMFTLPAPSALAGEFGEFTGRDAADGVMGRMGDLHGTPEERGQRIHEQTVDQHIERVQRNQGDGAALREQRIYREQYKN